MINKMLDPQLKAEWVAALRSGNYEQGRGALTTLVENGNPTHCCLGVLCDILTSKNIGVEKQEDCGMTRYHYLGMSSTGVLPASISSLVFGIADNQIACVSKGGLTKLNDYGMSFADIADIIEAEL